MYLFESLLTKLPSYPSDASLLLRTMAPAKRSKPKNKKKASPKKRKPTVKRTRNRKPAARTGSKRTKQSPAKKGTQKSPKKSPPLVVDVEDLPKVFSILPSTNESPSIPQTENTVSPAPPAPVDVPPGLRPSPVLVNMQKEICETCISMATPFGEPRNTKWDRIYDQRKFLLPVLTEYLKNAPPPVFVMLQIEGARDVMRPETFLWWKERISVYMQSQEWSRWFQEATRHSRYCRIIERFYPYRPRTGATVQIGRKRFPVHRPIMCPQYPFQHKYDYTPLFADHYNKGDFDFIPSIFSFCIKHGITFVGKSSGGGSEASKLSWFFKLPIVEIEFGTGTQRRRDGQYDPAEATIQRPQPGPNRAARATAAVENRMEVETPAESALGKPHPTTFQGQDESAAWALQESQAVRHTCKLSKVVNPKPIGTRTPRLMIHRERVPDPAGMINWTSVALREQIRQGNCYHIHPSSHTTLPVTNVLKRKNSQWRLPSKRQKLSNYYRDKGFTKKPRRKRRASTYTQFCESDVQIRKYTEVCGGTPRVSMAPTPMNWVEPTSSSKLKYVANRGVMEEHWNTRASGHVGTSPYVEGTVRHVSSTVEMHDIQTEEEGDMGTAISNSSLVQWVSFVQVLRQLDSQTVCKILAKYNDKVAWNPLWHMAQAILGKIKPKTLNTYEPKFIKFWNYAVT